MIPVLHSAFNLYITKHLPSLRTKHIVFWFPIYIYSPMTDSDN